MELNINESFSTKESLQVLIKKSVVITGTSRGSKKDTFILHLDMSEDEQKNILEKMKKQLGCGGSYKNVEYEGKEIKGLHLQGDKIKKAEAFLRKMNINNLEVKLII
jgi:translation initiation factor 1 (eIF-1/SUI1)